MLEIAFRASTKDDDIKQRHLSTSNTVNLGFIARALGVDKRIDNWMRLENLLGVFFFLHDL